MPIAPQSKAGPWAALLLAGGFEVGYALSVNGSHGFTNLVWSLVAIAFFLLTLFFLSVALKRIDVGIGYAVWAGIGAVGAALLGPLFFDETLTPAKALWLTVIIAGVIWLKLADRPTDHLGGQAQASRAEPPHGQANRAAPSSTETVDS